MISTTAGFHVTNKQAALKCLYLVTRSLDPTGKGQTRWTIRWKPALNAFANTFGDPLAERREVPLAASAENTDLVTGPP